MRITKRRFSWAHALFVVALAWVILPAPSSAADRAALIIGNSDYLQMPELRDPSNDATDMGAALRKVGFDVVEGIDLTKAERDGAEGLEFFPPRPGRQRSPLLLCRLRHPGCWPQLPDPDRRPPQSVNSLERETVPFDFVLAVL